MKAIALTLLLGVHAHAADNRWALKGPDGGRIDSAAASNGALYASAHRSVYKSIDGGISWFSASNGLKALIPGNVRVVAHPSRPGTLAVAGGASVFISTDGGGNWHSKRAGLPNGLATLDVAFAPNTPSQLWLASRNGLWRSVDGGENWTAAAAGQLPANIERVAVDPANANRLLVWAGARNTKLFPAALYQSTDGGIRFVPIAGAWDANEPARADLFAFNPNSGEQFFLAGSFGSFSMSDGGTRVRDLSAMVGGARLQSLATTPLSGGRLVFGTTQGIIMSDDGGASFTIQRGAGGSMSVRSIAIDPHANGRWVAFAASGDVLVSADAGRGWSSAGSGLRGNRIAALAAQPQLTSNLLAGVRGDADGATALYRSENNGQSWTRSNTGLTLDRVNTIAFDAGSAGLPSSVRVYAAGAELAGGNAAGAGAVFVSNDSGRSWSSSSHLLPAPAGGIGAVNAMLIDADSTRQNVAQTLYFAADGRIQCSDGAPKLSAPRIWRSVDAAASWQPIDGLPLGACKPNVYAPRAVALAYLASDRIVAGTRVDGYCAECGDSLPTVANGVFVFSGGRWSEANDGLPRMSGSGAVWDVTALAAAGEVLYAGLRDPSSAAAARIYRSEDAGVRWVRSDAGVAGAEVRALHLDATKPYRVFASLAGTDTAPGGVYRSTDGGASWKSTSIDLPSDGGGALTLTQLGGVETLHTGSGEGAWISSQQSDTDADGATDAAEDLAPNGGDGNNDGFADRLQSGVATVNLDANKGAAQQGTLSDIQLRPSIKGSSCTQIVNVGSLSSESLPSDPNQYQARLPMQFEFVDCPYALVEIVYHNFTFAGSGWQLRRYGPTVVGDASSFAWQTVNGAVFSDNSVVFPLTDNTAGDHQSVSNRIFGIVVPVQPE